MKILLDEFLYYFFAPNGRFEPCGMFTFTHIIAAIVCVCIAVACVVFLRKRDDTFILKLTRTLAYVITILEIIKMSHSFIHGELNLDAWFPLSYCGLFIFALWMSGYGRGILKRIGKSFITYGCTFAGVAFIIFPTTSLMNFPVYHFLSIYSLFFHTAMVTVGVLYLFKDDGIDLNKYYAYLSFVLFFSAIAIAMNKIFECNLMNLREPYNIPIDLIQKIYSVSEYFYTILVLLIYALIPYIVAFFWQKSVEFL